MVAAPRLNPASPLNDGLIAWYLAHPAFFEGTVWPDLSGGGHDGTLTDMASDSWANDAPVGGPGSLDFSVSPGGVLAPPSAVSSVLGDNPRTLMMWLKLSAGDDRILRWGLVGNGAWFGFEPSGTGVIRIARWGGGVQGTISLWSDSWRLATVVYHGDREYEFYVDGTFDASRTDTIPLDTSPGYLFVGRTSLAERRNNGRISDVRIYSRALSPTEIAAYYAESLGGYKSVLLSSGPVLSSPHAINHFDPSQLLSSPHLLGSFP